MAPLHAAVYDGASPPVPGAGFELDPDEASTRGHGAFAAPPPHPLWSDEMGREVTLEHAETLRRTLVEVRPRRRAVSGRAVPY
eukprot:6041056-Prymnesium_polylepis.1